MKEKKLLIKKISFRKLWWNIILILAITITVLSGYLSYYGVINTQAKVSYYFKNINMIISISIWTFYLLIILFWAILFRIRCKRNNNFKIISKYLNKKINFFDFDKKEIKKVQRNLLILVLILNTIAIIFMSYALFSIVMMGINTNRILICLFVFVIFAISPLTFGVFIILYYKNSVFI